MVSMLTLYYKPTCVFSDQVIEAARQLGLGLELKDASFDESTISELIETGGKNSVPYLIDSEKSIGIYESKNIIEHLMGNYLNSSTAANSDNPLKIRSEGLPKS